MSRAAFDIENTLFTRGHGGASLSTTHIECG